MEQCIPPLAWDGFCNDKQGSHHQLRSGPVGLLAEIVLRSRRATPIAESPVTQNARCSRRRTFAVRNSTESSCSGIDGGNNVVKHHMSRTPVDCTRLTVRKPSVILSGRSTFREDAVVLVQ